MSELKELASVLKRIWDDMEEDQKIDFELAEKILIAESENLEDPQRAKQAITMLVEEYLENKVR